MNFKINQNSHLNEIYPNNSIWKTNIQQIYYEAVDRLIDLGMDSEDAIEFVSDLYWAFLAEFES